VYSGTFMTYKIATIESLKTCNKHYFIENTSIIKIKILVPTQNWLRIILPLKHWTTLSIPALKGTSYNSCASTIHLVNRAWNNIYLLKGYIPVTTRYPKHRMTVKCFIEIQTLHLHMQHKCTMKNIIWMGSQWWTKSTPVKLEAVLQLLMS